MRFMVPFRQGRAKPPVPFVASATAVLEYCVTDFYGADGARIDSLLHIGCASHVTPDLQAIATHIGNRPCAAIVLRHAHPSGIALPSKADIAATRTFARFVRLLGARLHDHVIEGGPHRFSFREAGLL